MSDETEQKSPLRQRLEKLPDDQFSKAREQVEAEAQRRGQVQQEEQPVDPGGMTEKEFEDWKNKLIRENARNG